MSDLNTSARITLQANGKQVADTLNQLKQRAFDLENALAKAAAAGNRTDIKKIQKEIRATHRQIKNMTSSAEEVERVLLRMDKASPKELRETLRQLQKQLDGIERGSEAWQTQTKKIRELRTELDKMNAELREGESFWQRFNRQMNDWQTTIMAAAAAVAGLIAAGRSAVNAYAEMDAEMANVRKFTRMSKEGVEELNEAFKKMDTRTGRDALNKLAQEAGRLGKTSQEDVLGFVRAADQINVALEELGDGATLTLSKLANIFGDEERLGTEKSLLAIGSVINELSENCTASAPYLAQFAQRMAGVGAQAKLTIPQIMGFAAVLDSQGQAVEMSATALSKLIMDMFKQQDQVIKATGINAKKFKETLKESTNEGLLMLINRLHELGNIDVLAPVFKDMGENGARAAQVISALAGNLDKVKWQQEEAAKAFAEGVSVTKEFNVQNTTVQAGLDKAKKRVVEMAVELGEKLAPVMKHVISSTTLLLKLMSTLITFIGNHIVAISTLTAMIVAYTIAVKASTIATKAQAAWVATATAVSKGYHATIKALHAAHLLLQVGLSKLQGNWARQSSLMLDLKKSGADLAKGWGVLVAGAIALGVALYKAYKNINEAAEGEKALQEVRKKGAARIAEEKFKIEELVAAAKNETLSLAERQKAINALNQIIPNYNAQLDATTGKYKANKNALDDYLKSLQRQYEIEGAKDMLKQIGKEKAELNVELNTINNKIKDNDERYNKINNASTSTQANGMAGVTMGQAAGVSRSGENAVLKSQRHSKNQQLQRLNAREAAITGVYGKDIQKDVVKDASATSDDSASGTVAAPNPEKKGKKTDPKAALTKELQAWKAQEEAINRIAYAQGEKDYEAYSLRMQDIAIEYAKKQMERTDLTNAEKLTAEADYYEAIKKKSDDAAKATLEKEKQNYADQLAVLQQKYADGESTQQQYEAAIELAELKHLQKMVQLTKEGTKERAAAEKAYNERRIADQQKRQKAAADAQAKLAKIKESYFGDNADERLTKYEGMVASLEQVYKAELKAAGTNATEKLRIEESFQKAKLALQKKYNIFGINDAKNNMEQANNDLLEWLDSDAGKAVTDSFNTIVSGMSGIFSNVSSLVQAELDIETAAIEKRYESEIAAAEGNTYKVKKLEEQKQKDLAEAKNKANKKMFAMQVIQAVAQTAQNAIAAYGSAAQIPIVGYVMAPIAAAMATAAGLLQIATIKKQQQASEAQGYAEGGFTQKGDRLKPVGVVHAGEWVAPQRLVNSPQTRPLIDALEVARRSNTMGVLPQLVSPIATPNESPEMELTLAANVRAIAAMQASISKLNKRLNEPFVTINTVEGDAGIKKAQDDYNRLMRNKAPKQIKHAD